MEERKYLIIALRYWNSHNDVLFWGKDESGYSTDLNKAGLYTKEEARRICRCGDCYISIESLGITKEIMDFKNDIVRMVVPKTHRICKFANTWETITRNVNALKHGA